MAEMNMHACRISTLCYIESDDMRLSRQEYALPGSYEKEGPLKWNGLCTRLLEGESPDDALLRGLTDFWGSRPSSYRLHAMLTVIRQGQPEEYLLVYTAQYPGQASSQAPSLARKLHDSQDNRQVYDYYAPSCKEGWVWLLRSWFYEPLMPFNDRGLPQVVSGSFPFFSMKLWIKNGRLFHWHLGTAGDPFPGWDGRPLPPDHEAKALGIPAAPKPDNNKQDLNKRDFYHKDLPDPTAPPDTAASKGTVPVFAASKAADSILKAAWSYYKNRSKLIYSGGRRTFLSGWQLYDPVLSGRGNIDCSTYILLVCSGISYEDSPYAAGQEKWNLSDKAFLRNSDADAVRKGLIKSGTIRSASDIARYFYVRGCCFTDPACAGPGDLVFFRAKPDKVPYQKHFHGFLCISHVGILTEDLQYLEATGSQIKPADPDLAVDPIRLTPLSSRKNIVCFARPDRITDFLQA